MDQKPEQLTPGKIYTALLRYGWLIKDKSKATFPLKSKKQITESILILNK